jgi:hypothetical protein
MKKKKSAMERRNGNLLFCLEMLIFNACLIGRDSLNSLDSFIVGKEPGTCGRIRE